MRSMSLLAIIPVALSLSGCFATMSKSECVSSDWRTIGLEDAAKGKQASYIENHRKACAEYGIAPDLNEYRAGRRLGLQQYCTPSNGFVQGKNGNRYNGVCPQQSSAAFLNAYNAGKSLYTKRSEISRLRSTIKSDEKKLSILKGDIYSIENKLASRQTPASQRQGLVNELRKLRRQQSDLENKLIRMKTDVGIKQVNYNALLSRSKY